MGHISVVPDRNPQSQACVLCLAWASVRYHQWIRENKKVIKLSVVSTLEDLGWIQTQEIPSVGGELPDLFEGCVCLSFFFFLSVSACFAHVESSQYG